MTDVALPMTSVLGFDSEVDADSDLNWDSGSIDGNAGRGLVTVDDTNPAYGILAAPTPGNEFRYRLLVAQALSWSNGNTVRFFYVPDDNSAFHYLQFRNNGGTAQVSAIFFSDGFASSNQANANLGSITQLEVHCKRSEGPSANNGFCKVYADEDFVTPLIDITGIDNYDIWVTTNGSPDSFRLGAITVSSGVSGNFSFTRVVFRNTGDQIGGPNTAPVVDAGADQTGTLGQSKVVDTVSFTDTEGNVDECNLTCEDGGTITVVANGSAIVTGNGTNAVNITGTQAEVLATIDNTNGIQLDRAQVEWTDLENPPPPGHITYVDTVNVEVIDDGGLSHEDSFDVTWTIETGDDTKSLFLDHATVAGINAEIAAALYQPEGSMEYTDALYVEVTDGNGNSTSLLIPVMVGAPTLGGSGGVFSGVGAGVLQGVL